MTETKGEAAKGGQPEGTEPSEELLKAQADLQETEVKLAAAQAELELTTIESELQAMVSANKLAPAALEIGLAEALLATDDSVEIGDLTARQVILKALENGTKLSNLKTPAATEEGTGEGEGSGDPYLEKLEDNAHYQGVDVLQRIKELQKADPKVSYRDAMLQARRELNPDLSLKPGGDD